MNCRHGGVEQLCAIELTEDRHDAAGAMHVLEVVVARRRHFAKVGNLARQAVDVAQVEVDLAFLRGGQQVQHGVGRATHGDVQRHGVLERRLARDVTRQDTGVVFLVVAPGQVDDGAAGLAEKLLAVRVRGYQ